MPVRKIPKTFRSVTGRFPSVINGGRLIGYESRLERDFYLKLEFDRTVASYEEQPRRYNGIVNDKKVSYTPDTLITFLDGKPKRIVEVKFQHDLDEHAAELEPRFSLARNHARENGEDFAIVTEVEVYDEAHDNYNLIYRHAKPPNNLEAKRVPILEALDQGSILSLRDLLHSCETTRFTQAEYMPAIWHLIFKREIEVNLYKPINYETLLRIPDGKEHFS